MAESHDEEGALEALRKRMYSPEGVTDRPLDRELRKRTPGPSKGWERAEPAPDTMKKHRHTMSGAAVFFAVSVLFFFIAAGVSAYLFLAGGRSVSTDNVIISVQGPTTIAAGDTVPLLITIDNKNPVPLTDAEFVVAFPEGSRSADAVTEPIARFAEGIGQIAPGERVTRTVRVVLFGEERQVLPIPMTLSYRTQASNAVFVKEKKYEIAMTSSPLSVSVSSLSEISVGQPLTFSVLVRSNASTPLENVALATEYPFGFTEAEMSEPALSPGLFSLGTLEPGAEKRFTLTGTLTGLEGDDRVFRFSAGTVDGSGKKLALSYSTRQQEVKITAPFLATNLTLEGSTDDTISVAPGETVNGVLAFANTLAGPIHDAEIRIELSGDAIDRESVRVSGGSYLSSQSSIVFNQESNRQLAVLQPGDKGDASFSFKVQDTAGIGSLRNPTISVRLSVSGRRVSERDVPEQLASTVVRTVKVASGIALTSDAVRTIGPFENQGPWPPTPDVETTYTIRLGATNTVNSVADAVVTTTLPSYVRFTNITSATTGTVTYDETTREVKWNLGALSPDASASAAFQVALLPSISQRGAAPTLVTNQTLTAFDRFVQKTITSTENALSTQLPNDPAYQAAYGPVRAN